MPTCARKSSSPARTRSRAAVVTQQRREAVERPERERVAHERARLLAPGALEELLARAGRARQQAALGEAQAVARRRVLLREADQRLPHEAQLARRAERRAARPGPAPSGPRTRGRRRRSPRRSAASAGSPRAARASSPRPPKWAMPTCSPIWRSATSRPFEPREDLRDLQLVVEVGLEPEDEVAVMVREYAVARASSPAPIAARAGRRPGSTGPRATRRATAARRSRACGRDGRVAVGHMQRRASRSPGPRCRTRPCGPCVRARGA